MEYFGDRGSALKGALVGSQPVSPFGYAKAAANALGHLTEKQFDQWVKPESMVGIKIKAPKKKK